MPANSQSVERAVDRLTNSLTAMFANLNATIGEASGGGKAAVDHILASHDELTMAYGDLMTQRDALARECDDLTRETEVLQEQRDALQARIDELIGARNVAVIPAPAQVTPSAQAFGRAAWRSEAYVRPLGGPDESWSLFVPYSGGWLTVEESKSPELVIKRNTGEVPMITFAADLASSIYGHLYAICQALLAIEPEQATDDV